MIIVKCNFPQSGFSYLTIICKALIYKLLRPFDSEMINLGFCQYRVLFNFSTHSSKHLFRASLHLIPLDKRILAWKQFFHQKNVNFFGSGY